MPQAARKSNIKSGRTLMKTVETYEPTGVLKPVDDNIWIVDGPIEHMQQFGLSLPFPTRMTVIRLRDDNLFIHSPVRADENLYAAIEALGRVAHLVSPNKIHYAAMGLWAACYPEAVCWASPGVRERAAKHRIAVPFSADLQDAPPPDWAGEIDQLIFRGSRFMDEVVFFHKASATLILADLIENFEAGKISLPMRFLVRLGGNLDPDGKLSLDLRLTFTGRRRQACRCYERMMAWHPERIILAHGRWYRQNGTQELRRAFRWLGCEGGRAAQNP